MLTTFSPGQRSPHGAKAQSPLFQGKKDSLNTPLLSGIADHSDADAFEGSTSQPLSTTHPRTIQNNPKHLNQSLFLAATKGHLGAVEACLAQGANLNQPNKDGFAPLNAATCNGHTEIVKLLLEQPSIEINQPDKYGYTPLTNAAAIGHTEIVKLLLKQPGIEINQPDKDGATPLAYAAAIGHTEIVKLLLKQPGIEINQPDKDGATPLAYAARYGHTEAMSLLLKQPGIDINQPNKDGFAPLNAATRNGQTEAVSLLLKQPGIEINQPTKGGYTPLNAATFFGYDEIIQLLKAANAKSSATFIGKFLNPFVGSINKTQRALFAKKISEG
jgi:ankyrin repeat protein